jgi:hypothetical protein
VRNERDNGMTKKSKPKYAVGDELLLSVTVNEIYDDWADGVGYSVSPTKNYSKYSDILDVDEEWIEGFAPVTEPTKYGTVVVVDNVPWMRDTSSTASVDEEVWVTVSGSTSTWNGLLKLGNPKVIWEPTDE